MTGRLRGTLSGRPVELDAAGRDVLLRLSNLRAAWQLRRHASRNLHPILGAVREAGLTLGLAIGSRLVVEVLPKPSLAIRVFAPALCLPSPGEPA